MKAKRINLASLGTELVEFKSSLPHKINHPPKRVFYFVERKDVDKSQNSSTVLGMKKITLFILWLSLVLPGGVMAYGVTDIQNPLLDQAPAWLMSDSLGGFYGETETGLLFTEQSVVNDYSIKLHKFTISDTFWYITDKGVIEAENDLVAISIYLARA